MYIYQAFATSFATLSLPLNMFLVEIFPRLCDYLPLSDILVLRQTSQQLRSTVSETCVRDALLYECPLYKLKYSSCDNWVSAAYHFLNVKPGDFSDKLDCPVFIDQPLPSDFHCLCKDVERTFAWDYSDQGICFQDKLLDLTNKSSKTFLTRNRDGVIKLRDKNMAVSYNGLTIGIPGKMIQSRHTSKAIAAISEHEGGTYVIVRFRRGQPTVFKTEAKAPFRLQVIDDTVLLHAQSNGKTIILCISPNDKVKEIECKSRPLIPAGIVLYNGTLFNIDFESRYEMSVSKSITSPNSQFHKPGSRLFRVYQDETHPEYCLVYKPGGIVVGLIDLKAEKADIVHERGLVWEFEYVPKNLNANDPENYCRMVGISGGSVGVWKYTRPYLSALYMQQHGLELPDLFKNALKEIISKPETIDLKGKTTMEFMLEDNDLRRMIETCFTL